MFPIFKLFVCFVIQCEPIRKNVLGRLALHVQKLENAILYSSLVTSYAKMLYSFRAYVCRNDGFTHSIH